MIATTDGSQYFLARPNPLISNTSKDWDYKRILQYNWDHFAVSFSWWADTAFETEAEDEPTQPIYVETVEPIEQQPPEEHKPIEQQERVEPPVKQEQPAQQHYAKPTMAVKVKVNRFLYLYHYNGEFDKQARTRYNGKLREKPISVKLVSVTDNIYRFDKYSLIETRMPTPMPGSRILDLRENKRFVVIDVSETPSTLLLTLEQEQLR